MCGIVGYRRFGKKSPTIGAEDIELALIKTSERGKDATGFFTPETGIVKDDLSAKAFVSKYANEINHAAKSRIFIGHTRQATGGRGGAEASPQVLENDHPMESENWVLVHNGSFRNSPEIKDYNWKGTCDTEIALAYLETFGPEKAMRYLSKSDNFSLVFYHKPSGELYFYREANPLVFTFIPSSNTLIFASTSEIGVELSPVEEYWGLTCISALQFMSTKMNHLYKLDSKGVHCLGEIKPTYHTEHRSLPREVREHLVLKEEKPVSPVSVVRQRPGFYFHEGIGTNVGAVVHWHTNRIFTLVDSFTITVRNTSPFLGGPPAFNYKIAEELSHAN